MQLSFDEKYQAIGQKQSAYEGIFITAVKTTGIFCRPSCRARKPLARNVEFYGTAKEALAHGFRPCKVCRPMEPEGAVPDHIRRLIQAIHDAPDQKIRDVDLRAMRLEPNTVRRWFKTNHNLTFHAYQRMIRINAGYRQIKAGQTVTATAFANGFESLSGFTDGYKSLFGESPGAESNKAVICLNRFSTQLGAMFVAATDKGVCLVEFADRRMLETQFKDLRRHLNAVIVPGGNAHTRLAEVEVETYLAGQLQAFTVSIDAPGTEFQQQVWGELQRIGYGETRSYAAQAIAIGRPTAVRAVARANGMNRIALIIPCHRVIGADGSLTGYAGGLPRKKWLLDMEARAKL